MESDFGNSPPLTDAQLALSLQDFFQGNAAGENFLEGQAGEMNEGGGGGMLGAADFGGGGGPGQILGGGFEEVDVGGGYGQGQMVGGGFWVADVVGGYGQGQMWGGGGGEMMGGGVGFGGPGQMMGKGGGGVMAPAAPSTPAAGSGGGRRRGRRSPPGQGVHKRRPVQDVLQHTVRKVAKNLNVSCFLGEVIPPDKASKRRCDEKAAEGGMRVNWEGAKALTERKLREGGVGKEDWKEWEVFAEFALELPFWDGCRTEEEMARVVAAAAAA